jgi:hypothetical protein
MAATAHSNGDGALAELGIPFARGEEAYVERVLRHTGDLGEGVRGIGVTEAFKQIIDEFGTPPGETPPGFRVERRTERDGAVRFDLVRDLAYDRNGELRPTPLLFSVDSANPYEIAPCASIVANLTCNPGIVYDLFLNDPKANIDHRFSTIDEVMGEIAGILGPGCDMSLELPNPFEPDFERILDQVHAFAEIVSHHRLVVKVPHTGPVNATNVRQLLEGEGRLDVRHDKGATADYMRGHNIALRLHEHGFRVNFTLMFEPYQQALALQARPYFINAFIRHRLAATATFKALIAAYEASGDHSYVKQLRAFMVAKDYLASGDGDMDLLEVLDLARAFLHNRRFDDEGADGLDAGRQALRWLRTANLPDTRLILCSMEGDVAFPDIMRMLTEPEFLDMHHRVLVTTEPSYLARWTSAPQVVSYHRRFMRAAREVNEQHG